MNTSVEIQNFSAVSAYLLISPNSTFEKSYDDIKITLICENLGSYEYDGYSQVKVFDPNGDMIYSVKSEEYSILPSWFNQYVILWNVDSYPAGTYSIEGTCFHPNGSISDSKNFDILGIALGATTEGVEKAAPPSLPAPAPDMVLDYPPFLNLTQAVDYPIVITVKNTGGVPLHNIIVELESDDFKTEISYPVLINVLEPGESKLVVGLIRVSPEQGPGKYTIDVLARSDEKSVFGTIEVQVVELEIKEKAKELLDYYDSLIEQVKEEMERIEREEKKNVTKARSVLDEARQEWYAAKKLFELRQYQDSIDQLYIVKEEIKESIVELAKAPPIEGPEEVRVPAWLTEIVLYLMTTLILFVWFLIILKRRREKSRFRRFSRW